MFIGEYQHSVDEKGRITFPAKFRKALSGNIVITRGLDTCLFIYTLKEWQKLTDKLASLPMSQANARAFSRFMLAGAMDAKLDGQGRILLPDYLRTHAKIRKDAVLVGVNTRLELWAKEQWATYTKETESHASALAEKMVDLGV